METLSASEVETPPLKAAPQPTLTPQYIITADEIVADRDPQLGVNRRTRSVSKGFWNNSLVSIKLLSNDTPVDVLLENIKTWHALRHPHVIQVFGVSSIDADPLFIVSQYYPHGNANEFLFNDPSADRAKIMFECALGMQYLHGCGIVHGGLKPTNILIADNGQVCVADYGMIKIQPSGSIDAHRYFSPEAWKGTMSQPSDVYAFAMSSYEIFMSVPPWGVLSESHVYQLVVREDDRPDRLDPDFEQKRGLTDQIWKIIQVAWQNETRLRPTFAQIVESWYSQFADDGLVSRPVSPSNSVAGSGARLQRGSSLYDPRNAIGNSQTWLPNATYDSTSMQGLPPAYRNLSIRRPHPSRPFSLATSLSSSETTGTNLHTISIADSTPPSPSLATSPGGEDLHYPSTSSTSDTNTLVPSTLRSPHLRYLSLSAASVSSINSSQLPRMSSIGETGVAMDSLISQNYVPPQTTTSSNTVPRDLAYSSDSNRSDRRQSSAVGGRITLDTQSIRSEIHGAPSITGTRGRPSAVLLAGALHAEVTEGRKQDVIDDYLHRTQSLCSQSDKEAQRLVTAGIVPTVILLLRARALDATGLEIVLTTLGVLACDPITANTIYRTNTALTLIEIINTSNTDNIIALSVWCIIRICRSAEVATGLIRKDLVSVLIQKGLKGNLISSCLSAWCLGNLIFTDHIAGILAGQDIIIAAVDHLRYITSNSASGSEDRCAAIYLIARIARTTSLAKSLLKAGCVHLIVGHLSTSEDPRILHWSARAIGCLMRPNAGDIAKALLDAGSAKGLARMPHVLATEEIEPLASFAFAIQRFSVAEWGAGTRRTLVEAGVVDSLLSALRTAADVPYPNVHIELALAVSFLGDVGGTSIRKEIVRAGGIEILKRVGAAGKPELAKACNMAVTSITGNLWTRNAASTKTAMSHNWSGGCPEYQPERPLTL